MKLLVVSHAPFARSGDEWLAKNRVAEIVEGLQALGWDVTVLARENAVEATTYTVGPGVRVIALGRAWRPWAQAARALLTAPRALVLMPAFTTALSACLLGRRAVIYAGGSWGLRDDFPGWRARLELLAARRVSHLVVAGDTLRAHFLPHARSAELCVPHVHAEVVERLRGPGRDREERSLRVLFVGGIDRLKGIRELVAAARALPDVEFRIVGQVIEPKLGGELAAAAAELPNLATDGYREWDGLRRHYAWANVLALPSYTEGFPRVLYEASAFDLAPVVTPVGGIPARLEDAREALFVEVGSVHSLVAAFRRLADDPALRRQLARAARAELATSFSDGDAAAQLDRALRTGSSAGPVPARELRSEGAARP